MLHDAPTVLLDDVTTRSWVHHLPAYLALDAADALFAHLHAHAPLVPEVPVVFGKPRPVKRESCVFGEPGVRYRYSGLVREALPWPDVMLPLVQRLRDELHTPFNFVLCNRYPDGDAALGWHADDEVDLQRGASIASISLGATRDFAVRFGTRGTALFTVALAHGSLVVMGGNTQEHYRHRVPARRRCTEPRINLTFRVMDARARRTRHDNCDPPARPPAE